MIQKLRLIKGKNNGIINGILYLVDRDGNLSPFDLTGATLNLEVYNDSGVAATIAGTVVTAADGIYSVKPGTTALNALTSNLDYYYRIVVVNATYTAGLAFDTDADGRPLRCIVI